MKWEEFKSTVDEAIKSLGGNVDEVELYFIDTGNFPEKKNIDVGISEDLKEVTVTS